MSSNASCRKKRESRGHDRTISLLMTAHLPSQRRGQVGVSVCWYFRPEQVRVQLRWPRCDALLTDDVARLSIPRIGSFSKRRSSNRVRTVLARAATRGINAHIAFSRPLRGPPAGRHPREGRLPVHRAPCPRSATPPVLVPRLAPVRVRLAVQRP